MLALPELQHLLGKVLLTDDEAALSALEPEIAGGVLTPRERLAVYRNNVLGSLTDVLRETFPVICRLVGEQFFAFTVREFIAAHPPVRPSLSEYGEAFPAFLEEFPPCRDLLYLADTARLEWLLNVARYARDIAPVSASCLSPTTPDDAAGLVLRLHPAVGYLASRWPVDRIWRANQPQSQDESVDLDQGGALLEVSRRDNGIVFRALDEAEFAFRRTLAGGAPLGIGLGCALAACPGYPAADAGAPLGIGLGCAFAACPGYPAADALAALFHDGLIVAVTRSSSDKEHAP